MRLFIDVTVTQVLLFTRRIAFVIYAVLMLVLAGAVIFTDDLSGGTGALVVRVSHLLFFQLPLLALLISPLIAQNQGARRDWLWTTSLELPLLVLSQFAGVALVLCVTFALNAFLMFAVLVLVGTVPAGMLYRFTAIICCCSCQSRWRPAAWSLPWRCGYATPMW